MGSCQQQAGAAAACACDRGAAVLVSCSRGSACGNMPPGVPRCHQVRLCRLLVWSVSGWTRWGPVWSLSDLFKAFSPATPAPLLPLPQTLHSPSVLNVCRGLTWHSGLCFPTAMCAERAPEAQLRAQVWSRGQGGRQVLIQGMTASVLTVGCLANHAGPFRCCLPAFSAAVTLCNRLHKTWQSRQPHHS